MPWRFRTVRVIRRLEQTFPELYTGPQIAVQVGRGVSAPATWFRGGWVAIEYQEPNVGKVVLAPNTLVTLAERCVIQVPSTVVRPYKVRYTALSWLLKAKLDVRIWEFRE